MKHIVFVILTLIVVTPFSGCDTGKSLEVDNKGEPPLKGLQTPTPYPYQKGAAKVSEIINKTFTRCDNDANRNLAYAFTEAKYLLEIQDVKYNSGYWSSIFGLSPTELSADETWESTAYFRAEVTGKYDIYARKWEYREGKPKELHKFTIKRVEGKWDCDGCGMFQPVTCKRVQELLDEKPRYRNHEE